MFLAAFTCIGLLLYSLTLLAASPLPPVGCCLWDGTKNAFFCSSCLWRRRPSKRPRARAPVALVPLMAAWKSIHRTFRSCEDCPTDWALFFLRERFIETVTVQNNVHLLCWNPGFGGETKRTRAADDTLGQTVGMYL